MNTIKINQKAKLNITTKNLVITGMFTAVICVLAITSIPTQPVPFTLSVFAIFLAGALLPPKYAVMAVLAYILLGAFGLPVFANFKAGVGVLFGKTGGYIMSYPLMALVVSLAYHSFKKKKVVFMTIGMVIALLLCYLIGTLWFSYITKIDFYKSLTLCVFPFVLFDTIKIVLAVASSIGIRKALENVNFEM